MGDMREVFDAMRERDRERRVHNLKKSREKVYSMGDWIVHTEYHWTYQLNGKRLDYWPSRNKFRYENKVYCGDVVGFIYNRKKDKKDKT